MWKSLLLLVLIVVLVGCGGELTEEEAEATANAAVAEALARVQQNEPCPTAAPCPEVESCPECEVCPDCPAYPEVEPCPECPECPEAEAAPTEMPEATEAPAAGEPYALSVVGFDDPAEPGMFYSAEEGMRLIGVEVILENVSGDPFTTNPLYSVLVDSEGFNYDPELAALEKDQIDMFDLSPGEKARGWIGFMIPEGAVPVKLKYDVSGFSGEFLEAELP